MITATHRRLLDRIAEKSFREDLYYRLNVIHVEVPPLRERVEDIGVLIKFFLREFSTAPSFARTGIDARGAGVPQRLSVAGQRP